MKRFLISVFVVGVCLIPGCCTFSAPLVVGVKAGWDTIGPRYVEYVNNDPRFKSDDPERQKELDQMKADWLKTAEMETDSINRLAKRVMGK